MAWSSRPKSIRTPGIALATLIVFAGASFGIGANTRSHAQIPTPIVVDGRPQASIPSVAITSADQTLTAEWRSDGQRHWLRADVVSQSGKLELLGNPVYVSFGSGARE